MTNLKTLDKDAVEKKAAPDSEFALELLERLEGFELATQADADKVSAILVEVKTRYKELETQRTSATKPLLAAKRNIDSWFKPAKDALGRAEKLMKGKLSDYLVEAEQAKDKALACDTSIVQADATTGKGVSAKHKWTWKVTDISKVPEKYSVKVVNADSVDAAVEASGGQVDIPGIEVSADYALRVNARK